jgi:hypothetical protein
MLRAGGSELELPKLQGNLCTTGEMNLKFFASMLVLKEYLRAFATQCNLAQTIVSHVQH